MDTDPTGLTGSVSRLFGAGKSLGSTQRASELAQDQLADESVNALNRKSPNQANGVSREKIRRDRERRQKEHQRKLGRSGEKDIQLAAETSSEIDFTA